MRGDRAWNDEASLNSIVLAMQSGIRLDLLECAECFNIQRRRHSSIFYTTSIQQYEAWFLKDKLGVQALHW